MGPTQGPLGSLIHPEPPFDLDLHLRPRTPSSAPPGSSLPPAFATHRFLRALPRAVAALQGLLLPVLGAAGHVGGVAALLRRGGRARGDRRGPGGAGARGGGRRRSSLGAAPEVPVSASILHPELPDPVHTRPRLLAGPEGCAPRPQGAGLPVGGRSPAQLQVREGPGRPRGSPGQTSGAPWGWAVQPLGAG